MSQKPQEKSLLAETTQRTHGWFPMFVVANVAIFVVVMCINNCPKKNCWSLFCYLSFLYFDQVSLFICLTKMQNWHSSFQYFSFQSSNFQFYHFNPQTFNCCQFGTPLDLSYLLLLSESKRCRFFFFWVIKKN